MPNHTDFLTPHAPAAATASDPVKNLPTRARRFVSFAALAAIPLAAVACGSSGGSTSSGTTAKSAPTGNVIAMKLIAYKPSTMEIKVGESVTWKQMDPGFHTATSGTVEQGTGGVTPKPDGKFDSGQMATGKTFSYKFTKAGTYPFFCEIHPATMSGTITVK